MTVGVEVLNAGSALLQRAVRCVVPDVSMVTAWVYMQ